MPRSRGVGSGVCGLVGTVGVVRVKRTNEFLPVKPFVTVHGDGAQRIAVATCPLAHTLTIRELNPRVGHAVAVHGFVHKDRPLVRTLGVIVSAELHFSIPSLVLVLSVLCCCQLVQYIY